MRYAAEGGAPCRNRTTSSRIELPPEDELDADIRKYFDKCEEKLGLVPNVLRAYTGNPAKFRAFTAFYNQLMLDEETCGLSKLEREMIAVVVSSANRCYYCLVAHGQAVRELSGDPELGEMMVMNYRVAELEPRHRAMLDFAWTLTLRPHDIGEKDRQRAPRRRLFRARHLRHLRRRRLLQLHQPHGPRPRHDAEPRIPRDEPVGPAGRQAARGNGGRSA